MNVAVRGVLEDALEVAVETVAFYEKQYDNAKRSLESIEADGRAASQRERELKQALHGEGES